MAIYDGKEATHEYLLEITKACAVAAAKAPTLTNSLNLRMEIVTGEDLDPMIDVLETFGKTSTFQMHDAVAFKAMREKNVLPPVLLLGADLCDPVLWDCGACGFPTCGEYIKFVKRNKGIGIGAYGPSCIWKVIDFGMAADYACAAAAMHRVEARLLFSMGAVSMFLGRLEGSSFVLGLPVGPVGINNWFDRESWVNSFSYIQRIMGQLAGGPSLSMAFSGGGYPVIKTKQDWWDNPTFMKVEQDEAFIEKDADGKADVFEKIMSYRGVLDEE
jgi:uncharacterized ferredoxin-like protein